MNWGRANQTIRKMEQARDEASKLSRADSLSRRERLAVVSAYPMKIKVERVEFARNVDVIEEVLDRAGGVCESCRKPAPFKRRSNGLPYLEVHHKIRLADDGPDTADNAVALCPNCHREAHYG